MTYQQLLESKQDDAYMVIADVNSRQWVISIRVNLCQKPLIKSTWRFQYPLGKSEMVDEKTEREFKDGKRGFYTIQL